MEDGGVSSLTQDPLLHTVVSTDQDLFTLGHKQLGERERGREGERERGRGDERKRGRYGVSKVEGNRLYFSTASS